MFLAPSVLAANFANLESDIQAVNGSNADYFHIDIMDGVFVPNISFGFPVLDAIYQVATKPLDIHLMIVQPEKYVEKFAQFQPKFITVHAEACVHLHRTIQQIKELGIGAGVALNPGTPVASLKDVVEDLDLLLLMSVNPGFGGQKFIAKTYDKIAEAKKLVTASGSKALIEIDGGVDISNAEAIVQGGVDILVAGSSVFNTKGIVNNIQNLKSLF